MRDSSPRLAKRKARPEKYQKATLVIRYQGREYPTGCAPHERAKAEIELNKFRQQLYEPADFGDGDPAKVLVIDCLERYYDDKGEEAERGLKSRIDRLLSFCAGEPVAQLLARRRNVADDYVKWRTAQRDRRAKRGGRKISKATCKRELGVLMAAVNHCRDLIDQKTKKPLLKCEALSIDMPELPDPVERFLTRSEVARLLWAALGWDLRGDKPKRLPNCINRHLARFILIALYTGSRRARILRLQWKPNLVGGRVDLASGLIHRRAPGERETNKKAPACVIVDRLRAHLERWHRQRCSARWVIEWDGAPITEVRRAWATAVRLAGFHECPPENVVSVKHVTPHIFKHTCITLMLQRGRTVEVVSDVTGTSPETIYKVYRHHLQSHTRREANAAWTRARVR